MTTGQKAIERKLRLIELGNSLKNVSEACRKMGVSRQHFYDVKKAYECHGMEGLKGKNRRKPNFRNRVSPKVEEAVVALAYEFPAYGQVRSASKLRQRGILVSPGGIRSIWLRHGLQTVEQRVIRLQDKEAVVEMVYTEVQNNFT